MVRNKKFRRGQLVWLIAFVDGPGIAINVVAEVKRVEETCCLVAILGDPPFTIEKDHLRTDPPGPS